MNVLAVDQQGFIQCAHGRIPEELPSNLSERPVFQAAQRNGRLVVLPLGQLKVGGAKALPIAYQRLNNGVPQGVIIAVIDLHSFDAILDGVPIESQVSATVYDSIGNVIAQTGVKKSQLGTNQSSNEVYLKVHAQGSDKWTEAKNYDGEKAIFATTSVSLSGTEPLFVVSADMSSRVAYHDAWQTLIGTAMLVGVGLVGVLGATAVGADLVVVRPMRRLQRDIGHASAGGPDDLTKSFKGPKELSVLASAFGALTRQLNERALEVETSRQRLQTIVDSAPGVSFLMSPELDKFYEMSSQLSSFIDVSPEMAFDDPSAPFSRLADSDGRQRWYEAACNAIGSRQRSYVELAYRSLEDSRGWMRFYFTPVYDAEGGLTAVQGFALPITDLVKARDELASMNVVLEERVKARTSELVDLNKNLERANADLADANRELEAFSYTVSHDLRSPLRAIVGYTQIILATHTSLVDEEGLALLGRVKAAAERMGDIIDDLLSLARLARQEVSMQRINLTEVAREILDYLRASHPDREMAVSIEDDLVTRGDPTLIRLAMQNLLENAWKFSRDSPNASIAVGAAHEYQNGASRVFFVRDNGVGFDMEYADRLWEPFQRLHTQEEFPGTGIGLAIVSRILLRHGGKVWADSEPGKGTTVFLELPATESDDEEIA